MSGLCKPIDAECVNLCALNIMHVSKWGCDDVKKWLSSEGFEQYCHLLCDIHGVDGEVLLTLNEKARCGLDRSF